MGELCEDTAFHRFPEDGAGWVGGWGLLPCSRSLYPAYFPGPSLQTEPLPSPLPLRSVCPGWVGSLILIVCTSLQKPACPGVLFLETLALLLPSILCLLTQENLFLKSRAAFVITSSNNIIVRSFSLKTYITHW